MISSQIDTLVQFFACVFPNWDFDLSVQAIHSFFNKHGSRDKFGKVVHYGARGWADFCGRLAKLLPATSSGAVLLLFMQAKLTSLFKRVMGARRTVRWLSGTGLLLPLLEHKEKPQPLPLQAARGLLLSWTIMDHVRWLQQIGWVPGDQARTKRIGFSFAALSWFVNFCWNVQKLLQQKRRTVSVIKSNQKSLRAEDVELSSEEAHTWRQVMKFGLMTISACHISEIYTSSNFVCGIFGSLCAAIDVYTLWPRKHTS